MATTHPQRQSGLPGIATNFRTVVDPPLRSWQAIAKPWRDAADASRPADLLAVVNHNASTLGTKQLQANDQPLWVTGHQAWLWHPGILAKDIAAAVAADRYQGDVVHLVVDHDIHDALHMQLPVQQDQQLRVHSLHLAPTRADFPSASQSPADFKAALEQLKQTKEQYGDQMLGRLDTLETAITSLTSNHNVSVFETLGQQMASLTACLLEPWTGSVAVLLTSQICELEGFSKIVSEMLADASRCIAAYNRAVLAHPQAGIGPLAMDRQLVELPLWLLTWQGPRQKVYADITDSSPLLVTADGQPVVLGKMDEGVQRARLAPRAMLLTAVVRKYYASVFVHGTGGGVYDKATEAWWQSWRGDASSAATSDLAPMAVATADLRLAFDLPIATAQQVMEAQQKLHHLKHNLNHQPGLTKAAQKLASAKQDLLDHMNDDGDKHRKSLDFKAIHAINDELASLMPDVIAQAHDDLVQARAGLANHAAAMKRDWPFVIYPDEALAFLAQSLRSDNQSR